MAYVATCWWQTLSSREDTDRGIIPEQTGPVCLSSVASYLLFALHDVCLLYKNGDVLHRFAAISLPLQQWRMDYFYFMWLLSLTTMTN